MGKRLVGISYSKSSVILVLTGILGGGSDQTPLMTWTMKTMKYWLVQVRDPYLYKSSWGLSRWELHPLPSGSGQTYHGGATRDAHLQLIPSAHLSTQRSSASLSCPPIASSKPTGLNDFTHFPGGFEVTSHSIWGFPKIGVPPNHPFVHRGFPL